VTKEEIKELIDSEYEEGNYKLIDVRSFLRGEDFKIPNSVNIPSF
jgi:hypothetical protein